MENNGLQKHQAPGTLLILSDKAKAISKVIIDVNDLVDFKKDVTELLHWSADIERLEVDLDMEKLKFLMDCFKTEKIMWDKTKGIQNIFAGLKQIKKIENGYVVLRNIY